MTFSRLFMTSTFFSFFTRFNDEGQKRKYLIFLSFLLPLLHTQLQRDDILEMLNNGTCSIPCSRTDPGCYYDYYCHYYDYYYFKHKYRSVLLA